MTEQKPLNKMLLIAAIVLGTIFLFVDTLGWHAYKTELKPLAIWVLAAVAFTSGRKGGRILGIGLLFGSGGDILLETGPFLAGVGSFLISQLIYAGLFVWIIRQAGMRGDGAKSACIPLFFAMGGYVSWLGPDLGDMFLPIICYMIAIGLMGITSLLANMRSWKATVGALSFIVSDSLIALGLFKFDFEGRGALVWITYVAAQYLITVGILEGWDEKEKA